MGQTTYREANRRYRRLFIPAMIVYGVLAFGGAALIGPMDPAPQWLSAAVAIVTAAPMGVVLWLMWRLMRETDEFTRLQQAMAMAAGGMITAFFCMVWGFLELYAAAPKFWTFLAGPMFLGSYGLVYRFGMKRSCEPGFEK